MTYIVVWLRIALDELAMMWINADSALRDAITAASHQLEQDLKTNPETSRRIAARRPAHSFRAASGHSV